MTERPESDQPAATKPKDAASIEASGRPAPTEPPSAPLRRRRFFALRGDISPLRAMLLGVACLVACGGLWWALTAGEVGEERILSPATLPSPSETFADFPNLWVDDALTRNLLVTLRRVALGFALAALVGVPLGVLCGCFKSINAFFAPLTIVGRNIPIAALIPLTFSLFGIAEFSKVMFIFLACVAFVLSDTARAVADVKSQYVDTAYTLGAGRWQIIRKVLVPLALPSIFNSMRLLFGLAFGYIMLAEGISIGVGTGGLGNIILVSQRRNLLTRIYLVLMIIPLVALAIDRLLYWVQRELFPYQYGTTGVLYRGVRGLMRGGEDVMGLIIRPKSLDQRDSRTEA